MDSKLGFLSLRTHTGYLRDEFNRFSAKFDYKNLHDIQVEKFDPKTDIYFVKNILLPYLSSVYFGIINRGTKDYLSLAKIKQYMDMPDLVGERICRIINANGDERIDHDEFIKFFAQALMGSKQ